MNRVYCSCLVFFCRLSLSGIFLVFIFSSSLWFVYVNFHSSSFHIFSTVTSIERNSGISISFNFIQFQLRIILVGGHVLFVGDTYIRNLCLVQDLHFFYLTFYPHCQVCECNHLSLSFLSKCA